MDLKGRRRLAYVSGVYMLLGPKPAEVLVIRVVDDHADSADYLCRILSRLGYDSQ